MNDPIENHQLSLLDEFILMLLDEESGYFYQVAAHKINCAIIGAALAELSLLSRIDTDVESLLLLDSTETGNPSLDLILKEIVDEPVQHNAQYWIEKLFKHAETITDFTLENLVDLGVLEHHQGDFWTVAAGKLYADADGNDEDASIGQFIRTRIGKDIFSDDIPHPRDIIIVCLIETCDIFPLMFKLNKKAEERIKLICRMDLIGRSMADAVAENINNPLLTTSHHGKKIPRVSLHRILLNPHARTGNLPALFADLTKQYGPVFEIAPPFSKPNIFLSGAEVNRWVRRHGRKYLTSKTLFGDFEKVYGAVGILPALDGADHFRYRKTMTSAYSRGRLEEQLDVVYSKAREYMANWKVGESYPGRDLCRKMINAQMSPLSMNIDTQDIMEDIIAYKERALSTHLLNILPKFMLETPGMKRRAKAIDTLMERVQSVHTAAQRAGCPRNFVDDLLSLNANYPLLMPESNLSFALSAVVLASMYLGDGFSFALYAMASQPELYEKIQSEADALFSNGDPTGKDLTPANLEITDRFVNECLRVYPIVPMSMRGVVNTFTIEGYEIPQGARINIAQTAPHYMEDSFPDPFSFDIDRYLPPRNEHKKPGYAPYGLGPHTCLGNRWMTLHMAVNLLIIAHYFTLRVYPENYKLGITAFPSMKPNKKLKFHVAEQKRELPV
ncbi:MAG: cytochrome P450 [Candidatus Dadabacteria bacterium]|nr:cytochrome P450 [Candidatus Dadabacteria bacterium]MDE0519904.1 cytochrome P450 [Candidatus Dadabacteria bacterium]MDE0663779.1 cytochrome P450 [Candidatus Dadabacteria bacterium]